jgi:hypothetical protein
METATATLNEIASNPSAQQAINRSYELMMSIMVGVVNTLQQFHKRFRFQVVVGCPRSGGSYLTKQLFQALGMDAEQVPSVIAHDGFPGASPFQLVSERNEYTAMTRFTAEYLTMVELFFSTTPATQDIIMVPKKMHNAAYYGAFFRSVLGPESEFIITIRHPVAACISTYEKSGGLPEDGKFQVRGHIEESMVKDIIFLGGNPDTLHSQDYFDVYLRYWEQYYCNLALTGLSASKNWIIVPYGENYMTLAAKEFYDRFKLDTPVDKFYVSDNRDRHPEWSTKAEQAISRVHNLWQALGLKFPVEEIMEAW